MVGGGGLGGWGRLGKKLKFREKNLREKEKVEKNGLKGLRISSFWDINSKAFRPTRHNFICRMKN